MIYKNITIFTLFCLSIFTVRAKTNSIPKMTAPVVDKANILSRDYEQRLNRFIRNIHDQTGNQLQVLTVSTLEGEPIEEFSIRVTDKWQLGDKEKDNGVLFVMAVKDRLMRIEVGQGLEGYLTDLQSRRIINGIRPYFRKGNFDGGVNFAIKSIANNMGADTSNAPRVKKKRKRKPFANLFSFLIIIVLFILRVRGGFLGLLVGGSRGWSRGGGGWSGGRGGGWSGGGGGFSGGGSSGSW